MKEKNMKKNAVEVIVTQITPPSAIHNIVILILFPPNFRVLPSLERVAIKSRVEVWRFKIYAMKHLSVISNI